MGFSISWVCVQGNDPLSVKTTLSLQHVGTAHQPFEAHYTGLDLGRRGYLIAIDETTDPLVEDAALAVLSEQWKVIACEVEEHAMCSVAQCWSNGKKDWRIEHNAQVDPMHLHTEGYLPDAFYVIKERVLECHKADKDNDVDYMFEVPCLVAWKLTGFKHDRGYVLGRSGLIEELAPSASLQAGAQHREKSSWWKFW